MRPGTAMRLFSGASRCFPGLRPRAVRNRGRMLAAGLRHRRQVGAILETPADRALGRAVRQRPELMGVLVWPYQCAAWEAPERLRRLAAHYAEIDRLGPPFLLDMDARLVLADLGELHPGLAVVLDQPRWFMREGGLTVNLFEGSFRAFSLAFSLHRAPDGTLEAVIGGIQGRNRPGVTDLYRDLTKALHGLRPRDFTIEVFRMLARAVGVQAVLAVSEAERHHRHPFFGGKALTQDYDAIWADRGGTPADARFHRLPLAPERRDLATVKPNKRSLYRRRHAFLDALEARLAADLPGLTPVRFPDS